MIYIHWAILLIYFVVVIGTIITVLLDNRQPAKTMAWLLVLVFLPIVGIILYFFFGQNTRKERLISQRSLDQLTKRSMLEFAEQRELNLPEKYRTLINLFTNQNWALPFKDNVVDIYTSGYEFFPALLQEIGKATNHIHMDFFIISDDPLGRLVADALIDKAREGVEVRIIYDDVGSWNTKNKFFERMRDAGIDVHAFMPVKFPRFTSRMNYRNHRKLCVIDGTVGFMGGMNIAMRYVKGIGKMAWRDTHMRIRGGLVYAIQRAFLIDWYFVDRTLITDRRYYPELTSPVVNDSIGQVVISSPISPWPDIALGYVRIVMEATKYVYMESPYFLPTEPLLFAMRTAALAGIDVRLMVPYRSDARITEWAGHSYIKEVMKAGVKVYLYKAGFNHSKLLVCDDSLCTCGSTNVDSRSFENDFESNAFFYDRDLALRFKQIFLQDQAQSVPASEVSFIANPSFARRLGESLIRLISPVM